MPIIEWNSSFSVGNDEIDQQHKRWFAIFNDMHETLLNGTPEDFQKLTLKALQDMRDYAKIHFSFEENYMREIGYPDLVAHRRLHKDFDTQIYENYRNAEAGSIVLNSALIKMIRNWLMQHILVEDVKYKLFAQKKENNQQNAT